jgi:hypothetical protein
MKRIYLAIAWLLLIATPSMGQTYTLPEYMSEAVNLLPDHTKDSDPETVRTIRTIAVLAGLGDTLEVMGPGRFGLRGKSVDIGDWNLNPLLVAATQKWLSERFEIKNITYDAAALGRIGPMDWYSGRDARRFLGPLSNNGIDAFVVIRRAAGGLQLVAGDDQDVFEVANFQIEIIDSRKWELVGRLPSQIRSRLGNEGSLPVRIASRRLKPGGDLILMPEQLAEVHQDFLRADPERS